MWNFGKSFILGIGIIFMPISSYLAIGAESNSRDDRAYLNELPMYGNIPPNEYEKKCNEKFINDVVKQIGSREAASEQTIELGWKYLYNKDLKTAMKRFNQAWLLNSNNAEAFYGFGILTSAQGKTDEAITYYKRVLELNSHHQMAMIQLGRSYADKSHDLFLKKKLDDPDEEVKIILSQALYLYNAASKEKFENGDPKNPTKDEEWAYLYYLWAIALDFNNNHVDAWQKIELSRKYGGAKIIDPEFIKLLSCHMSEPNEK